MKHYDEEILSRLLDKYESSALFRGENRRSEAFRFPITQKSLPDYFDTTSTRGDMIELQLEELSRKGLVTLTRKGQFLTQVVLCTDHIEDACRFLGRKEKRQVLLEAAATCDELLSSEAYRNVPVIRAFLSAVRERLNAGKDTSPYFDMNDPAGLRNIVQLVAAILANEGECYIREFSVRCFHDSKVFEKELGKACSIIRNFTEDRSLSELNDEELLSEFSIQKNPSPVFLKGNAMLRSGNSVVSLTDFPEGLGISGRDAATLTWEAHFAPEKVLTIENLTSFHRWQPAERELVLYLGGYPNRVRCDLLRSLFRSFPDASFVHFGDIDCGGFRIWKNLCEKTGISFDTIFMDLSTYRENLTDGKPLTENDRKMLTTMITDPFFSAQIPLFEEMLRLGIKEEQECLENFSGTMQGNWKK